MQSKVSDHQLSHITVDLRALTPPAIPEPEQTDLPTQDLHRANEGVSELLNKTLNYISASPLSQKPLYFTPPGDIQLQNGIRILADVSVQGAIEAKFGYHISTEESRHLLKELLKGLRDGRLELSGFTATVDGENLRLERRG